MTLLLALRHTHAHFGSVLEETGIYCEGEPHHTLTGLDSVSTYEFQSALH